MNLGQFLLKFINRKSGGETKLGLIGKFIGLIFLLVLLIIPNLASDYVIYVMVLGMLMAILAASYDLLMGYTGQLSFCQGAFYGLGAYTSALLTLKAGFSFWAALPLTLIFTFLIAVIVGYPSLKLRGAYFAVTTFFFAHFVYLVFLNSQSLTRGPLGLPGISPPESLLGLDFSKINVYYYFVFVVAILVVALLYWLIKSDLGKIFISIREDQHLAESLGVNVSGYKLLSFSISATLAGLAGCLFAHFFGLLHPSTFAWIRSEMIVIMTLVGGAGTLFGPILGAGSVTFILELMRFAPELRFLVWTAALIIILIIEPKGLMGILKRLTTKSS